MLSKRSVGRLDLVWAPSRSGTYINCSGERYESSAEAGRESMPMKLT